MVKVGSSAINAGRCCVRFLDLGNQRKLMFLPSLNAAHVQRRPQ